MFLVRAGSSVIRIVQSLALGGLLLTAGCGDYECKEDESYCDGNVRKTCDYDAENEVSRWKSEGCGDLTCTTQGRSGAICATRQGPDERCDAADAKSVEDPLEFCFESIVVSCTPSGMAARKLRCEASCLESGQTATCTESQGPDPRCEGRDEACDGNLLIHCDRGYSVSESPCINEASNGEYCIQSGKNAFCSHLPDPDPSCTAEQVCDGANQLTCRDGYRIRVDECETGFCAVTSFGPTCTLASEPEPACAGIESGRACDENEMVACIGGYAIERIPCGEAMCRTFDPSDAACVTSDTLDPKCVGMWINESYCEGDILMACAHGYPIGQRTCAENEHCEDTPGNTVSSCVAD